MRNGLPFIETGDYDDPRELVKSQRNGDNVHIGIIPNAHQKYAESNH